MKNIILKKEVTNHPGEAAQLGVQLVPVVGDHVLPGAVVTQPVGLQSDRLQQRFVVVQEAVSAGPHQPPDVVPVQRPLGPEPVLGVLVDTLQQTSGQVVGHLSA